MAIAIFTKPRPNLRPAVVHDANAQPHLRPHP
jgi:hypothetical protein